MTVSEQKIGILTFHKSLSYGAVLQSYALYKTLKDNSAADVGLIDFSPPRPPKAINDPGSEVFYDFLSANVPLLTNAANDLRQCIEDLKEPSLPITDIVVGSDQVWNPSIIKDTLKDYFAAYDFPGIRKHAYAASFGTRALKCDEKTSKIISQAIADYRQIGVREKSGVDICSTLGRNDAVHVLDPTLLADPAIYKLFINDSFCSGNVCGYFLSKASHHAKVLKKIAKALKCPPVYLAGKAPFLSFIKSVEHPAVENFISAVHNSSGVVTDSFHGVCFSIIFKRPFVVLPSHRKDRFNRIAELLENFGLLDRVIASHDAREAAVKMLEPIDYDRVEAICRQNRAVSLKFINKFFCQ